MLIIRSSLAQARIHLVEVFVPLGEIVGEDVAERHNLRARILRKRRSHTCTAIAATQQRRAAPPSSPDSQMQCSASPEADLKPLPPPVQIAVDP